MEPLVELILVIAVVIVTAALLPLQSEVRVVLGFCGLVLLAVGAALFAWVAYPWETVLFLGAGSVITAAGWGSAQVTSWFTRRAATAITLPGAATESDRKS